MTALDLGRFGGPHHQALEVLCAKALARGDVAAAYRLADRRCRIRPLPEAHSHVLRAEALDRMGERAAAVDDLVTALVIAPDDLAANRRLLVWGNRAQQEAAVATLLEHERDPQVLMEVIAAVRTAGRLAVAGLRIADDRVEGWAAWGHGDPLRVAIAGEGGLIETRIDPDPSHALADALGQAARLDLPVPPGATVVAVMQGAEVLATVRPRKRGALAFSTQGVTATSGRGTPVTIVVPVYGDISATRACLASLLDQAGAENCHDVVIINDASPDPRIGKLLESLADRDHVRILTNSENLGFVGAVNRALGEVTSGDVILLNADTIVPEGFVARLAAVAHSAADIGTVTPLSNNGEFTSFPLPNQPNAAGSAAEVRYLDRIAARVNAGIAVDIPNGIGFCLYITRACLDAVGGLSDSYHRGYLEDVDFCLQARRHGFRNVCAPSVYVGHAGSRSFGKSKRALVVRNLEVIEQRFPTYRGECADFLLADSLKPARRAIEACLPPPPHATLLVSCAGAVAEVARARARQVLAGEVATVLLLELRHGPGGVTIKLTDAAGAAPQSLSFRPSVTGDTDRLFTYLRSARLARIELFDLMRLPRSVIDGLRALSVPYDVVVAHGEMTPETALACNPGRPFSSPSQLVATDPMFWRRVIAGAERVLAPDPQAEAIAASLAPALAVTRIGVVATSHPPVAETKQACRTLGLIPIRGGVRDHNFMRQVIVGLKRMMPTLDLVVIGALLDDEMLRTGDAFVTGRVDAVELAQVMRCYGVDRAVVCLSEPVFGHPLVSAAMAGGVPVACADWSGGHCPVRAGDLAFDPQLGASGVVTRLQSWLQRPSA